MSSPAPVQPVKDPIICKPFDEPADHWLYRENGEAYQAGFRRPASY